MQNAPLGHYWFLDHTVKRQYGDKGKPYFFPLKVYILFTKGVCDCHLFPVENVQNCVAKESISMVPNFSLIFLFSPPSLRLPPSPKLGVPNERLFMKNNSKQFESFHLTKEMYPKNISTKMPPKSLDKGKPFCFPF